MKNEHHRLLKSVMRSEKVTIDTIAKKCNVSPMSVSRRLTSDEPWTLDMVLDICDLCNIDIYDIPLYFERRKTK